MVFVIGSIVTNALDGFYVWLMLSIASIMLFGMFKLIAYLFDIRALMRH